MSKSFSSIKKELDQDDRVTFGKHAGLNWSYVIENYPDYLIWCVGNTKLSFSKAAIVAAIKSKYTLKKKNTTHEVDGEYVPDYKFNSKPAYPSKKPAYFYDGGLRGDMAHYGATLEQEANDKYTDQWVGGKGYNSVADWDDDVPF